MTQTTFDPLLPTAGTKKNALAHRLARVANTLFDVPIAVVTVLEATDHPPGGHCIISQIGLDRQCAVRDSLLWQQVTAQGKVVTFADVRNDPHFAADPAVTDAPHLAFFAGVTLVSRTGDPIGALCIGDPSPRQPLTDRQCQDLQALADAIALSLEQWRDAGPDPCPQDISPAPVPERASDRDGITRRFETLADALPQLVWSTPNNGQSDYFSQQWCEFTGAPASVSYGRGWVNFLHPDDVPITSAAWDHAVETGQPYAVEFRLRHADGTYRWMLARGLPVTNDFGAISRWIGTCTDIDERVRTSDLLENMSRELSHRIKNMFAVVQSLIAMALRKHDGMAQVSEALQLRMVALGRAHDLVRPRFSDGEILRSQTTLRELIRILTIPYIEDDQERLDVAGDDTAINEQAATPLALFLHEMIMNSARFGALNAPQGRLRITIAVGDDLAIDWRESGGLAIETAPEPAFGLSLTRLAVERQLGGSLMMDWLPTGLHAVAHIPLRQLATDHSNLR